MKLAGVGEAFGPVPLNRKNTIRRYTGNGMWCFSTCQQAGPRRQLMGQLCAVLTEFGLGESLIIIIASIRRRAWMCGVPSRPSYGAFKTCIRSGLPKRKNTLRGRFLNFWKIFLNYWRIFLIFWKIHQNHVKTCIFLKNMFFSVPEAPFLNYWKIFLNFWKNQSKSCKNTYFV